MINNEEALEKGEDDSKKPVYSLIFLNLNHYAVSFLTRIANAVLG